MNKWDEWFARIVLSPLALLYGLGIWCHQWLYNKKILKSTRFSIPTISVGNLSLGGSGKTPHIEYILLLLGNLIPVGTLSRGYGRKVAGYQLVTPRHNAEQVGDEPLQFKHKFPHVTVAVAASRTFAIPQMLMANPYLKLILLDDAFQHKAITPALNILLTSYDKPYTRDFLLPMGRLRDFTSSAQRADIIIVSKCPTSLTQEARSQLTTELKPLAHQRIYFSTFEYLPLMPFLSTGKPKVWTKNTNVLLITGIAQPQDMVTYVQSKAGFVVPVEFGDHHYFSKPEIARLERSFGEFPAGRDGKIIVTTEKDAQRLGLHRAFIEEHQLPIYLLPIQVRFLDTDDALFQDDLVGFLEAYKV
jgi:tetraacyldisaccharide 4'-kinase